MSTDPTSRRRWRWRTVTGERGSVTVELVGLAAPVALLLLMFTIAMTRTVSAAIDVDNAATTAARAASLARTPATAIAAAQRAVADNLAAAHTSCRGTTVTVDTSAYRPGGTVTVTVTCVVTLADLGVAGLTPTRTVTATSTSPLDVYRAEAPRFGNPATTKAPPPAGGS